MRRTAERVDEQLLTHMQANAIAGPWAAGERILVCVSEDPRAAGLVRATRRLADRLHAPWTAVSIETRRSLQLTEAERDRLADTLRLAESLGGEALTIPAAGRRIADDVIAFAHANNVTQIVIGKSTRSRWFEIMRGSVVHDLVRRSGNISVHVIAGDEPAREAISKKTGAGGGSHPSRSIRAPILMALAIVAVALGAAELIQPVFGIENVDLVFLTAVVGVAVRFGLWPSLLASVAASLCYNFFFLPPVHTFHDRRSDQCRGVLFLHADRDPGLQPRRAGAQPGDVRDRPGADHRVALRLQPQARGHRDAGRRAVGDRLSGRADAQGARGAAAARGRRHHREGRLSPRGPARQGRPCRRELGMGQRSPRGPRLRYAARRKTPVPADADRPRRDRRDRHRRRPHQARC